MIVYAFPADGDYYWKRICHEALVTETDQDSDDVNGVVEEHVTRKRHLLFLRPVSKALS